MGLSLARHQRQQYYLKNLYQNTRKIENSRAFVIVMDDGVMILFAVVYGHYQSPDFPYTAHTAGKFSSSPMLASVHST